MIPLVMSAFDTFVPGPMKFGVKELFYAFKFFSNNLGRADEIFSQVEVEINSDCNRKCVICPNHTDSRGRNRMELDLFHLLLDQLASLDFSGRLCPHFYSEPLLHENLAYLMSAARKRLPKTEINIYTNGSLLSASKIMALIDTGVDGIFVSQYKQNLPWDGKVRDEIASLPREYRRHIRYRLLTDNSPLSNVGGLVTVKKPVTKGACFKASNDLIIDYLGNVLLCCHDYKGANVFGNIQKQGVMEIWNKPEFRDMRGKLRRGDFASTPVMCRRCVGLEA